MDQEHLSDKAPLVASPEQQNTEKAHLSTAFENLVMLDESEKEPEVSSATNASSSDELVSVDSETEEE